MLTINELNAFKNNFHWWIKKGGLLGLRKQYEKGGSAGNVDGSANRRTSQINNWKYSFGWKRRE